jgi:CHAD domain-containing protein
MLVLDAFRAIAGDCLQRLSDQTQHFGDIGGSEALHQSRVAIRQLLAALLLFRPVLAPGGAKRFEIELRWIMGQLGDARNLDVLLIRFFDRGRNLAGPLLDRILLVHEAAQARANAAITSHRFQQLLSEMTIWLSRDMLSIGRRNERLGSFADRALERRWRKLRRQARRAAGSARPRDLHRLRISVKKMRYSVKFLAGLYGDEGTRAVEKFNKRLAVTQDRLGAINDLTMAEKIVKGIGFATRERPAATALVEDARRRRARLLRRIPRRIGKLRGTKPFWRR